MPRELLLPEEGRRILEAEGVEFFAQDLGEVPEVTDESLAIHFGEDNLDLANNDVDLLYGLQIYGVLYDDHRGNSNVRHRWLGSLKRRFGYETYYRLVSPYFDYNKIRIGNMMLVKGAVGGLCRLAELHNNFNLMSSLAIQVYRMESQYTDPVTGRRLLSESIAKQLPRVEFFDKSVLEILGILAGPKVLTDL